MPSPPTTLCAQGLTGVTEGLHSLSDRGAAANDRHHGAGRCPAGLRRRQPAGPSGTDGAPNPREPREEGGAAPCPSLPGEGTRISAPPPPAGIMTE